MAYVPQRMIPAQRREARIALAMLPFGAVTVIVSAVALVAVLLFALAALFRAGAGWWYIGWALLALVVAARNLRAGIAIMAAFDWRPAPLVLATSAAIVAAWPGWWLD